VSKTFPVAKKSFVETYSAGGIGLATAKGFLRSNIEGLLLVDKSQELLQTALSSFTPEHQQRCEILVADVSSEADCTYAERALERWGRLDIAVLNAGICFTTASITETDVEVWDKLMSVNARGGK
jgi:NAD(P)-dependent dehydrogenase (short-subunit alcohol dehydrogenase family)